MPTSQEKLAGSLVALGELQARGVAAIKTSDLSRSQREHLLANGFLREVMKGWYIATRPDEPAGESTSWYAAYWSFCVAYLNSRFGDDWCLSPERSLSLHAGNYSVPTQLIVRTPKGDNKPVALPFDTSLLTVRAAVPIGVEIKTTDGGLRVFSLPAALIAASSAYFERNATDVRAGLAMIRDASELLDGLLEGGRSTIAGRLAGGLRNIGRDRIADDILAAMRSAGYDARELDPFQIKIELSLSRHDISPYASRIRFMWAQMREVVIQNFPASPGKSEDVDAYLERVDGIYVTDAYNSLSIEGYNVSADLIERVRSGNWNPDGSDADRQRRDALAARGYWQSFQAVKLSLGKILRGENPGSVVDEDHSTWYREMFAPGVAVGILRPSDLAGYRNSPVFIRHSMHVPPSSNSARDAMPAFFELLAAETEPSVRVVLGHFVFVYIHPYVDGNGRMGRFLMNAMLAAGGYPWCIVPVDQRGVYMAALEDASVRHDIEPFTRLLAELVRREFP